MISTSWPGTSAWIKWVLPAQFLVSLVTWALGIAFYVTIANHEIAYNYDASRVSNAEIYFYSCGLPMATTLAALIDYILYSRKLLWPVASIMWGIVALGFWCFMLTDWIVCEYSTDTGGESCPDLYIFNTGDTYDVYAGPTWIPRLIFAGLAAVLALTQMALGARAVDMKNKERKVARRKERDDKRSFELETVA